MTSRPVMILAHPGHELLAHAWMEREKPVVLLLTDGSGGMAASRVEDSRRTIVDAGAQPGPLFGYADDKRFYRAILDGDAGFFEPLVAAATRALDEAGAKVVVSDSIEHCNPVHDLANVIAALAARRARVRPQHWELPIEFPLPDEALPAAKVLHVTPEEAARKREAGRRFAILADDFKRIREARPDIDAVETLSPVPAGRPLMPRPKEEAIYEVFGRMRIASGAYADLITFDGHVAPLSAAIAGAAHAD